MWGKAKPGCFGLVPASCVRDILGILTQMPWVAPSVGFLVLEPGFGWRNSQLEAFQWKQFLLYSPSKARSVHPFRAVIPFPLGFLGHSRNRVLGAGTRSYQKPWAEAILVPFPTPSSAGLGSSWGAALAAREAAVGVQAAAGSCLLLALVPFLQPGWNQPPPELLTGLPWEASGMTPLVSLSSPAPPPGAFCCRNKARRGHAANMCQELQRRKLASFA